MEAGYIDLFIPRQHPRRDGVIGYVPISLPVILHLYNVRRATSTRPTDVYTNALRRSEPGVSTVSEDEIASRDDARETGGCT